MVVSILRQILTMAYDAELVDRIVADRAKLPKRPAKRQRVLEPSDAVALFESVKGTEIELPVFLATVLGLRRAEICGLSWNDLDRQRKELRINQQAQKRKGKGTVTTKLKTEGSKRTLHLPDAMMKQLDDLGNIESLYICGLYKTEPLRPDWITRMWVRHRPANLEDWTFHDLRHASAYLLYSVTNNLETVRNVLGHADPDMSMAYIGSNRRNQEAAINAVAQALGLQVDK
jgi:integrase